MSGQKGLWVGLEVLGWTSFMRKVMSKLGDLDGEKRPEMKDSWKGCPNLLLHSSVISKNHFCRSNLQNSEDKRLPYEYERKISSMNGRTVFTYAITNNISGLCQKSSLLSITLGVLEGQLSNVDTVKLYTLVKFLTNIRNDIFEKAYRNSHDLK
ncbi:hypothetical protein AAG906_027079 [Vitis piasezkii]